MNYGFMFAIISVIFSAGAVYGVWRVSVNDIKHFRIDIAEIFKRIDNIDKQIAAILEWQRLMEKKINNNEK